MLNKQLSATEIDRLGGGSDVRQTTISNRDRLGGGWDVRQLSATEID